MRVQVMLFWPWISEDELQNIDQIVSIYNNFESFKIIQKNRALFESIESEEFDRGVEDLEQYIRDEYDEMNDARAMREQEANQEMINYELNEHSEEHAEYARMNQEEIEDEYGFVQFLF
jgi:hypothetical protein